MKTRSIDDIEKAFREMGLSENTWAQQQLPATEVVAEPAPTEQIFIRIETTTTPLEAKPNADLA